VCWIAKSAIGHGVDAGSSSVTRGVSDHRTRLDDVFVDSRLRQRGVISQDQGREERVARTCFGSPVSFRFACVPVEGTFMENVRAMSLAALGQRYRCYRLADPAAEEAMAGSLRRWGQASPVVACEREGRLEIVDGFKRWSAAPLCGWTTLSVKVVALDERLAKAAILGLNSLQQATRELEEAWIVQALVREDGLTQVEAAHLLGRHKSWVCRRLAFLERLSVALKEEMRLGLLGPTLARQFLRLPAGNQEKVLAVTRRDTLTARETGALIDLLDGAGVDQACFILAQPREALHQARTLPTPLRDPRLSAQGNWLARHLGQALEVLTRIENWLRTPQQREWRERDRELLEPQLLRVVEQARLVTELALGPLTAQKQLHP
jgi:ParB/RepB/Spo0J family partition protein